MKVTLKTITPDAELNIVEIARVSSSRKDKRDKPEGLINYLIKHAHWSPFEMASMTIEIETSKAIGIQLIRHRSFAFQEFSQRYQDVGKFEEMFEPVELRKQAEDNRQSSTDLYEGGDILVDTVLSIAQDSYRELLKRGVARECARMILPLATKTRLYMTGSIRSWIHFLDVRDDAHAQKEVQEIAREVKKIFINQLPIISNALNYTP